MCRGWGRRVARGCSRSSARSRSCGNAASTSCSRCSGFRNRSPDRYSRGCTVNLRRWMVAMDDASPPLDVTIVTGMSGAGRSATADVLEDLGFFVIDNLPPALIPKVAELGRDREGSRFALVVDTRAGEYLPDLESALAELRETGARTRVLFLDASDEVLVRRFDATRRRHPVAESNRVSEGIARERELLEEIKGQADIVVDTSELNVHELRDRLREIMG